MVPVSNSLYGPRKKRKCNKLPNAHSKARNIRAAFGATIKVTTNTAGDPQRLIFSHNLQKILSCHNKSLLIMLTNKMNQWQRWYRIYLFQLYFSLYRFNGNNAIFNWMGSYSFGRFVSFFLWLRGIHCCILLTISFPLRRIYHLRHTLNSEPREKKKIISKARKK